VIFTNLGPLDRAAVLHHALGHYPVLEFAMLQETLVRALAAQLDAPVPELNNHVRAVGSKGEFELDGVTWMWRWHGVGLAFTGTGYVNCYRRFDDPSVVDAWRLTDLFDCSEREVFEALVTLVEERAVHCV
jgi:hypothetical protein